MKYEIEKDLYKGKYILWEVHPNYKVELFNGYKYECQNELKKIKKRGKKNERL